MRKIQLNRREVVGRALDAQEVFIKQLLYTYLTGSIDSVHFLMALDRIVFQQLETGLGVETEPFP